MRAKVLLIWNRVMSLLPSKLPQSDSEVHEWCESVLQLATLPVNDSFKHALCAELQHLPNRVTYRSKQYFISTLKRGILAQAAFNVMSEINLRARAAQKAANEKAEQAASETLA